MPELVRARRGSLSFAVRLACIGCLSYVVACTPQPAAQDQPCRIVGRATSGGENLPVLYSQYHTPLIVTGSAVLVCSCGAPVQYGGAEEDRNHAGAEEGRHYGGAEEDRNHAGAEEGRQFGGAEQSLMCRPEPACNGYQVESNAPVRVYDGQHLTVAPHGCVVD